MGKKRDRKKVPLSKLNLARIEQLAKWSNHLLEEKNAKEKSVIVDMTDLEKTEKEIRSISRQTPEYKTFLDNTIAHYNAIIKMKNDRIIEIKLTLHNYEEEMKNLLSSI